jgi:hypothetical protein
VKNAYKSYPNDTSGRITTDFIFLRLAGQQRAAHVAYNGHLLHRAGWLDSLSGASEWMSG